MRLENKVAIVTGAKQGIGFGIAKALIAEGAKVVVADLVQEEADQAASQLDPTGEKAIGVKCDVSIKADADNLVAKTIEKFGTLDILVNNAGIYPFKPFEQMEEADWDKVMDVNLKGTFLCTQAAVKNMKEGSRIINISSIASIIGFPALTHYCSSKGGDNGFVRALALELAPKNITVNAVAPGAIETPGVGVLAEEQKNQILAGIPMKRMGKPEDIANAVVFLAEDSTNYITGQVIVVDGGWTAQ